MENLFRDLTPEELNKILNYEVNSNVPTDEEMDEMYQEYCKK